MSRARSALSDALVKRLGVAGAREVLELVRADLQKAAESLDPDLAMAARVLALRVTYQLERLYPVS